MDSEPNHKYPPNEWTVDALTTVLEESEQSFSIPRYDDRAVWEALQTDERTQPVVEQLCVKAEDARTSPIPSYPVSTYLDYSRTERASQLSAVEPMLERQWRLSALTLAECITMRLAGGHTSPRTSMQSDRQANYLGEIHH